MRHRRTAGALMVLGLLGAGAIRVIRVWPLAAAGGHPEGADKKDEKKDMKKKGNGPRTQQKKAKKGK